MGLPARPSSGADENGTGTSRAVKAIRHHPVRREPGQLRSILPIAEHLIQSTSSPFRPALGMTQIERTRLTPERRITVRIRGQSSPPGSGETRPKRRGTTCYNDKNRVPQAGQTNDTGRATTTKTVTAATVSTAAPSGSAPAASKHTARTDSAQTTRLTTKGSLPTRRSTTWHAQID